MPTEQMLVNSTCLNAVLGNIIHISCSCNDSAHAKLEVMYKRGLMAVVTGPFTLINFTYDVTAYVLVGPSSSAVTDMTND